MKPPHFALLFLFASLVVGLSVGRAKPAGPSAEPIRLGLSPREVLALLGPPQDVSRQILLYRTVEQWHYAHPTRRLQFDWLRGQTPILKAIDGPQP